MLSNATGCRRVLASDQDDLPLHGGQGMRADQIDGLNGERAVPCRRAVLPVYVASRWENGTMTRTIVDTFITRRGNTTGC